tara:strand:+ start:70 stop:456 length:387 start_codon:yes stop_codon:yes gene_type:complete
MRKFIIDNIKIYIGKTAIDNTNLVNNFKGTGFTWFHLKDYPSAHLIIEKEREKLNDMEIQLCANMVKYYSKLRKEWTQKYYVDIVNINNVVPHKKPGLVTISQTKNIKIKPCFGFNPDNFIYKEKDEK